MRTSFIRLFHVLFKDGYTVFARETSCMMYRLWHSNMDRDVISSMNYLKRQFLCCTPINKMDLTILDGKDSCFLNLDIQKQILDNTVNNDLIKQYPVKKSYQKTFLKLLIQKIEASGNDIHDDLYITYCRLMSLADDECEHYRHFLVQNDILNCITLKESTNIISDGTTGLCSWQGALVLSEWCAENMSQFRNKKVLELGCGVGLTGMSVISVCSPKQYVFSDCHETVLDMLCENVKLNFVTNQQCKVLNVRNEIPRLKLRLRYEQVDVHVISLRWKDIGQYLIETSSQPDIVIAADILYESDSFGSLITGLRSLLTLDNYAIIAATVRNVDTISQFLKQLDQFLASEECLPPSKQIISIQSIDSPVRILKIFQRT